MTVQLIVAHIHPDDISVDLRNADDFLSIGVAGDDGKAHTNIHIYIAGDSRAERIANLTSIAWKLLAAVDDDRVSQ